MRSHLPLEGHHNGHDVSTYTGKRLDLLGVLARDRDDRDDLAQRALLELPRSGILRLRDDLLRAGLLRCELLEKVALDVVFFQHRTAERALGLDVGEVVSHPEVIDVDDVDLSGDKLSAERPTELPRLPLPGQIRNAEQSERDHAGHVALVVEEVDGMEDRRQRPQLFN